MWQFLGALLQGGSSFMSGSASKRAGAESARGELEEAQSAARVIRKRAKETRAAATAAYAASGVDIGDGTPTIIDSDIIQRGEEDALAALLTGKRRAKAAKEGGQVQGMASFLQGAGDLYNGWIRSNGNQQRSGA